MGTKYCADCEHLEKRPCMAETFMDSGEYVQTGFYFRCRKSGAAFHLSDSEIEYQHCVCR